MTVLSDKTIRELCRLAGMVKPGREGPELNIQPCSVDVHLEAVGSHDGKMVTGGNWMDMTLEPGGFVIGAVAETFLMPSNVVGFVVGRSSLARLGLQVECAGLIDPGFEGGIVLEISNLLLEPSERLYAGQAIAQVYFMWLDEPCDRPYGSPGLGSQYQGQSGVRPSGSLPAFLRRKEHRLGRAASPDLYR